MSGHLEKKKTQRFLKKLSMVKNRATKLPELVDPLCLHIAGAGLSRTPRWSEDVTS